MKLTVAFLVACAVLAASDLQKRQAFYWSPYQQNGPYYYVSPPRVFRLPSVEKAEEHVIAGLNDDSAIRNNAFAYAQFKSDGEASPRFFFNNNNNNPGYIPTSNGLVVPASGNNMFYMNRLIRPVFVTSTVTVSNAVVSTCIPRINFISGSENNICSGFRKRREIIEVLDQLDDGLDIAPSNVEHIETTKAPRMINYDHHQSSVEHVQSSQYEEAQDGQREKRFFNFAAPTVTVTAYSVVNTTFTKTLQLLPATATGSGVLACRPSSIVVC